MNGIAQTIRLRPEHRQKHLELHSAVRPGVEAAMHRAHIRDHSNGEDFEADPVSQEWWELTDPCQKPWPDRGDARQWTELTEIWHLSPPSDDDTTS
jgi:L-rhamnose mutarotase